MLSGLEPEIQKLISKHKQELKKLRVLHEAELLQADERAAQRYVRQTEELRQQLERERDEQCQRERELAKQRYACPYILTCVWCTESSAHRIHICSSEIKPVTETDSQDDVFTDVRKHKHIQTLKKERETGKEWQRKLTRHDLKAKYCFWKHTHIYLVITLRTKESAVFKVFFFFLLKTNPAVLWTFCFLLVYFLLKDEVEVGHFLFFTWFITEPWFATICMWTHITH